MASTSEKNKEKKVSIQNILDQHVKNKNGTIFQVLQHKDKPHICYLRNKNKYIQKPILEIKQGIVDRKWFPINEGEFKKWLKEDNAFIEELTQKLIKRTIIAQLLIELDDELIASNADDKRFKTVLVRSNKEAERIAAKMYDKLYGTDMNMSQNLMNILDAFTSKCSKLKIHEFPYLDNMLTKYIDNPEQYKEEPVMFTEISE